MKQTVTAISVALLFMLLATASTMLRLSGMALFWTALAAGSFVAVLLLGSSRNKGV